MTAMGNTLRAATYRDALVTPALFEELRFWEFHFPQLNGVPMRPLRPANHISSVNFRCDACLVGYGIFFCGDSYYGVWTQAELQCFASFRGPNGEEAPMIALMELYTQVRAKLLLGDARWTKVATTRMSALGSMVTNPNCGQLAGCVKLSSGWADISVVLSAVWFMSPPRTTGLRMHFPGS